MTSFRTRKVPLLTIFGMPHNNARASVTLWASVRAIMEDRYSGENLNQLAKHAKIGLATTTRIKEQKTSTRIGTIEKIAKAYGLEPWQLLVAAEDMSDFLKVLKAWAHPRGRDMLITAAEGWLKRYGEAGDDRELRTTTAHRR